MKIKLILIVMILCLSNVNAADQSYAASSSSSSTKADTKHSEVEMSSSTAAPLIIASAGKSKEDYESEDDDSYDDTLDDLDEPEQADYKVSILSSMTTQIILKLQAHNCVITDLAVAIELSKLNKLLNQDDLDALVTILVQSSKKRRRQITADMIEDALTWIANNPETSTEKFDPEKLNPQMPSRSIWSTHIMPSIGWGSTGAVLAFAATTLLYKK